MSAYAALRAARREDVSLERLVALLGTPSPTGFTGDAVALLEGALEALEVPFERTRKGALRWKLAGEGRAPTRALIAHVDTLGAVVKEIKTHGRLRVSPIGGYDWVTVEGADVRVLPIDRDAVTGTVVNVKQSTHVHGPQLRSLERIEAVMEVRLDALVASIADVAALGIAVGDAVAFEARPVVTATGFVKSRHLDDKACVATLLDLTEAFVRSGTRPAGDLWFAVSTYEEVGHGGAALIPEDVEELVVLDMAAVGEGQTSRETGVTLCVKDSTGPYDERLGRHLRRVAAEHEIDLAVDVYPFYGSDGGAAWRSGADVRVALVGPGVDASHAFERTHVRALTATFDLVAAYATSAGG